MKTKNEFYAPRQEQFEFETYVKQSGMSRNFNETTLTIYSFGLKLNFIK